MAKSRFLSNTRRDNGIKAVIGEAVYASKGYVADQPVQRKHDLEMIDELLAIPELMQSSRTFWEGTRKWLQDHPAYQLPNHRRESLDNQIYKLRVVLRMRQEGQPVREWTDKPTSASSHRPSTAVREYKKRNAEYKKNLAATVKASPWTVDASLLPKKPPKKVETE